MTDDVNIFKYGNGSNIKRNTKRNIIKDRPNLNNIEVPEALGIVIHRFPAKPNTFIVNEIVELIKSGINLHIYSITSPFDDELQLFNDELQIIGDRITYLDQTNFLKWRVAVENDIPLAKNSVRATLSKNTDNFIYSYEVEAVERSFILLEDMILHMKAMNITKLFSPFANLSAEICMMLSTHMNIPFYFACHSYDLFNMDGYNRLKMERATKIFTISEYNKKFIMDTYNCDSNKVIVKRVNFIHLDSYDDLPIIPDYEYIFSAGRLIPMKGFEYSIRAFKKFNEMGNRDVHYIIAGEGSERKNLISLVKSLDLTDRVHFIDYIENSKIISYIRGSIFSILCSTNSDDGDLEGIPTFFIESMANGIPCIGSDYSGIPELIDHGKNGFLTKLDDIDDIYNAICELYYILKTKSSEDIKNNCIAKIVNDFDNIKNIKILIDNIGVND